MPAMLWTTDANLVITRSVGAGLAGLGLTPNQLNGMTLAKYLGNDDPNYEPYALHLRALRGVSVSTTITFQDRTFLSHLEPLKDARGEITGVIGVCLDITDRQRAEDRLRNQYQGFPVPTYTWRKTNEGFRLIDYNQAAEKITRGRIRELVGTDADTLFAGAPDIARDIAHCYNQRSALQRQMRYCLKTTGEEKDLAVTYVFLPPDLVMVHTEDIGERVRAENALRETNETLKSLIQASPLAIVSLDRSDLVRTWNPAACRIFGWTESEVLGKPLPLVSDANREEFESVRRADLRGEQQSGFEASLRRKDGSSVDISLWTSPVKDADGFIIRSIGILADNTDRKRAEVQQQENAERLLALSRRLLEVQELERRHVASELHDEIGQYLTGLGMMLDPLNGSVSPDAARSLEKAQGLLKELTEKVRDLSLRLRPTMLDDLGLLPALLWHMDRFTDQTQVHVDFQHSGLDRRMNPRSVETAAFRIVQEALTNVARHAGVKEATVRVHLDRTTVRIQIEDRGVGFDVKKARTAGSSSGLSGMRERAVLLDGWLWIDSQPGRGTCVTAELPFQSLEERRRNAFDPVAGR